MSVRDPYKAKRREGNPDIKREPMSGAREATKEVRDIPKTKKVRIDKT